MNKTKGAFESPELWSPNHIQSTSLTSVPSPSAFSQQATDKALNVILIVVLFVIMVSLGCMMEIAKITMHLRKPKGVAIAVMAQYGIMPLTAFVLGKLFQLGATESLAVLICGCCPGGNLSNIFSLALRGDMNLSIVMTTCSTVLAIGLMPPLLYLYSGGLYEGDLEGKVPYKGIITSLVIMLIPSAIGIILNEKKPQYTGFIIKMQADSMHGNWLPERTALPDDPQGCLRPRNHRVPVFLPTTLLAVPAWRGTPARPGL